MSADAAQPETMPADARTVARLRARIAELESGWQRDPAQWEAHVAGYTHRVAIMHAARKHGRALGYSYLVLLARRLMAVDVGDDGSTLAPSTAWARVEAWSQEGAQHREGSMTVTWKAVTT